MRVGFKDFGLLTTPQLHWLVASTNQRINPNPEPCDYVNTFCEAFLEFCELTGTPTTFEMSEHEIQKLEKDELKETVYD